MLILTSGWSRNLMENGQRKSMPDICSTSNLFGWRELTTTLRMLPGSPSQT